MSTENHWQLTRLSEFERPAAPASTRLQQLVQHIRNLFPKSDEVTDDDLTNDFPGYRDFKVEPGASAIDAAWQEWLQSDETGVRFLISPPFSGTAAVTREWAKRHQWPTLQAPLEEQLGGVAIDDWWQPQASENWIIDNLADYWQRRTDGL